MENEETIKEILMETELSQHSLISFVRCIKYIVLGHLVLVFPTTYDFVCYAVEIGHEVNDVVGE